MCVCVFFFDHVTWIHFEVLHLLLQATPTATPSFCQLAQTINQLSFFTNFSLNLVQVSERAFLQTASPVVTPLSRPLAWAQTHTFTHVLALFTNLQPPRAKTVATKESGNVSGSTDQPTDRQIDLQSCWQQLKNGQRRAHQPRADQKGLNLLVLGFNFAFSYFPYYINTMTDLLLLDSVQCRQWT